MAAARALIVLLALACAPLARAYDPADLAPTTVCSTSSSTQMLCLHNYTRRQHGLIALKGTSSLYYAASQKTARIVACNEFSHTPCGEYAFEFFAPGLCGFCGENAAYGYSTIRTTFIAWLDSPGHYANIVNANFRCYGSNRLLAPSFPYLWITDFSSSGC